MTTLIVTSLAIVAGLIAIAVATLLGWAAGQELKAAEAARRNDHA